MTAERFFETYSRQVCLIVEWMAEDRKSSIDEGKFRLKAACEQAVLDLDRDLRSLTELQDALAAKPDEPGTEQPDQSREGLVRSHAARPSSR